MLVGMLVDAGTLYYIKFYVLPVCTECIYSRGSQPGVLEPQGVREKLQGVRKKFQGMMIIA